MLAIVRWMSVGLLACSAWALAGHIEPPEGREPTDWMGPQSLNPSEAGIGRRIPDQVLGTVFGAGASLHDLGGERGTVILVRDPECPVSRVYGPRQARLAREYQPRGFHFVVLYLNDLLAPEAIASDAAGFDGPVVFIRGHAFDLARALGVQSTGDVFVLDADQRLVFRGAVDDQYGIGFTREVVTRRYLGSALDALLQGQPVPVPATTAPGCLIDAAPDAPAGMEYWSPDEQAG